MLLELSEDDFPINLPKQYRKHFQELHESLNAIALALSKVEDEAWRRKLAEMCILSLGFQELPEVRERLERAGRQDTENYIR
jgi:hypothetical protein